MSLSLKIESIFFIVAVFDKMEYEFENKTVLEVPKKLIIVATNLLVCYLIVKVSYIKLLLITKLIFIGIEFEIFGEISCTYDGPTKPRRETRPN